MAGVPGKGIKMAGIDHCTDINDGEYTDLDLGPGGLVVENSAGYAGQDDQESKIKGGN